MPADAAEIVRLAESLSEAQRLAIYPGPGNPDYARAKTRPTMARLHALGLTRDVPGYGGSLLTPIGSAVREHLRARAAQHDHEVG